MKKILFLLLVLILLISCKGSGRNLLFDPDIIEDNMIGDAIPYTELTNINFTNLRGNHVI